MTVTMMALHK